MQHNAKHDIHTHTHTTQTLVVGWIRESAINLFVFEGCEWILSASKTVNRTDIR